jgi:hypothetical protein
MASNQPRRLLKRPPDQLVDGGKGEYGNPRVLLNQVPDDHRRHDEMEYGGRGDGRLNIYRAGPSYNNDGRGRNSHHDGYPRRYNRPQQHQHRPDHGRHRHQQDRSRSREGKSTRQSKESLKRPPDELPQGEEDLRRLPRKKASPYSLQCRPLGDAEEPQELWWRCEVDPIPIATERILVDVLLPHKEREKGMMREKPQSVLKRIKNVCRQHGVDMSTACSLRRHHIKSYNLYKKMSLLRLGDETDINASAAIFEKVVAKFLRQERIAFYGEFEQRAFINENLPKGQPFPVTPDFMLKQPVLLKTYRSKEVTLEDGTKQPREVTQELLIHCKFMPAHPFLYPTSSLFFLLFYY